MEASSEGGENSAVPANGQAESVRDSKNTEFEPTPGSSGDGVKIKLLKGEVVRAKSNGDAVRSDSDTPLKSILKVKSEPILRHDLASIESLPDGEKNGSSSSQEIFTVEGIPNTDQNKTKHKKKVEIGSKVTLSYDNPAFEADNVGAERRGSELTLNHLSSVVDHVIHQQHEVTDEEDWHPFGRLSFYAKQLKGDGSIMDSEKAMLWVIFTVILIAMAGGIIFLSADIVQDVWVEVMESGPDGEKIQVFNDYMTSTWLEFDARFPVRMWNQHGNNGPRTNNHLEGFHNGLKKRVQKSHPNIYELIGELKKMEREERILRRQLEHGGTWDRRTIYRRRLPKLQIKRQRNGHSHQCY